MTNLSSASNLSRAMSKPDLKEPYSTLENQIIETLTAGLKEWRPDLDYPQSYSDMQAAVRGLFQMFEVKRRALPMDLKSLYVRDK